MKKFILISTLVFLCFFLAGCGSNNTISNNNSTNNLEYQTEEINAKRQEEVISTFSTNILDKDPGRQTNISITCSTLNGTVVKSGEIFSFCDTVGKSTVDRGYKEAKIFDADGNVIMGLRWWKLPSK